jgi:hypothetical protein
MKQRELISVAWFQIDMVVDRGNHLI